MADGGFCLCMIGPMSGVVDQLNGRILAYGGGQARIHPAEALNRFRVPYDRIAVPYRIVMWKDVSKVAEGAQPPSNVRPILFRSGPGRKRPPVAGRHLGAMDIAAFL